MQVIKSVIRILLTITAVLLIFIGVYFLLHGSLEAYPTDEQTGKSVIASVVLIILGLLLGLSSLLFRKAKVVH